MPDKAVRRTPRRAPVTFDIFVKNAQAIYDGFPNEGVVMVWNSILLPISATVYRN